MGISRFELIENGLQKGDRLSLILQHFLDSKEHRNRDRIGFSSFPSFSRCNQIAKLQIDIHWPKLLLLILTSKTLSVLLKEPSSHPLSKEPKSPWTPLFNLNPI